MYKRKGRNRKNCWCNNMYFCANLVKMLHNGEMGFVLKITTLPLPWNSNWKVSLTFVITFTWSWKVYSSVCFEVYAVSRFWSLFLGVRSFCIRCTESFLNWLSCYAFMSRIFVNLEFYKNSVFSAFVVLEKFCLFRY